VAGLPLPLDPRVRPTGPFVPDWGLHPSVVVGTAILGALYVWGITAARRRWHLSDRPPEAWRLLCFAAALVTLLLSLNGPVHDLSDYYLFSAHMFQHLVLTLLFPPLLIAGIPGWLLSPLLRRHPALARVGRVLTRPLVAGILFTVTITIWHVVTFYELMMRDHDVHVFTHILFMVSAVIMWWPVMSPVPEVPRLREGPAMLYLFLVSIPMQLVAALISLADDPLYLWYVDAPRTWGLSPLDDQKIGGLMMWVPANLWLFGAIAILFFRWAKQES
jgi:putative membrane protein